MHAVKIRDLQARLLDIPFRLRFKHHAADRSRTQTLLVRTRTLTGQVGFGEGCPREYVTGETLESCLGFVKRHAFSLTEEICTLDDLKGWLEHHEQDIDSNPAAWCAVELSLLDAISKDLGQNIEELLSAPTISGEFAYTAVLGETSDAALSKLVSQYVQMGLRWCLFRNDSSRMIGTEVLASKRLRTSNSLALSGSSRANGRKVRASR